MTVSSSSTIAWRHIFGVLVPDFNSVVEPELADMRPEGVSNQTTRFALGPTVIDDIVDYAVRLAPSGVHSWIVGLSTESFPGGLDLLESGREALQQRTGLPVHTPPEATRAALEERGVERIGIVTPFDGASNSRVQEVYENWDFEVCGIAGFDDLPFNEIVQVSDEETRRRFEQVSDSRVQALVQVGTGLPMLHRISAFERDFDRPIVTANAATYWQALRSAGIEPAMPNLGRLLRGTNSEGGNQ